MESFDLVPNAQRLDEPSEDQELRRDTIWFNPTDKDVLLELYVGNPVPRKQGDRYVPPKTYEQRTGCRKYVIKAHATAALDKDFDRAVQHTECLNPLCVGRPVMCTNRGEDHPKRIVGGLGPQLVNLGERVRPVLAPALDDVEARRKAAEEAEYRAYQAKQASAAALDAANAEKQRVDRELAERRAHVEALERRAQELAASNAEQERQRAMTALDAKVAAAVEAVPKQQQSKKIPSIQG